MFFLFFYFASFIYFFKRETKLCFVRYYFTFKFFFCFYYFFFIQTLFDCTNKLKIKVVKHSKFVLIFLYNNKLFFDSFSMGANETDKTSCSAV